MDEAESGAGGGRYMSCLLDIQNISISFGGIKAVQNVSFQVQKGEILGLIGPNGSGKSTCVNLITGVYPLDTGSITFDGRNLTAKDTIGKRAHMGMGRTFQTPKPFSNLNVFDNVFTIALQKNSTQEARRKTIETLEKVNLLDQCDMLSAKLPIEKRKWLDLARILVLEPKLIMMDEVMAGLNPVEIADSIHIIKRINQEGVTILFIEHVMHAVVNVCDRVVVLNEGRFLSEGEPKEVLMRPEVITAYIGGGGRKFGTS